MFIRIITVIKLLHYTDVKVRLFLNVFFRLFCNRKKLSSLSAVFFQDFTALSKLGLILRDHVLSFDPFLPGNPAKGYKEIVQTQIRRHILWRLIRVYSVC